MLQDCGILVPAIQRRTVNFSEALFPADTTLGLQQGSE